MAIRIHQDAPRGKARLGRATHGWAGSGWVRRGRVDGRKPGFDSPATRARGPVGHGWSCLGSMGLCMVRQGEGDWQPSGFEALTPALQGKAVLPVAWLGFAWQGSAWLGQEVPGSAGQRKGGWQAPRFEPSAPAPFGGAWHEWLWLGVAGQGVARPVGARLGWADGRSAGSTPAPSASGGARHGKARLGLARPGEVPATEVDHRHALWSSPASGRDGARLASARRGMVRWGCPWIGSSRKGSSGLGKEPVTAVGREIVSRPSTAPGQLGEAGRFESMHGAPRHGKARRVHAGHREVRSGREPVTAWGWGLVPQSWTAPGLYATWQGAVRKATSGPGSARCGLLRQGKGSGGRSSARFDSAPPTSVATAGLAEARRGTARQGFYQGVWLITRSSILRRPLLSWAGRGPLRQGVAFPRMCGVGHGRDHHFYLEFRMFQPVGDKAQWVSVYDALAALEVGKVLTYEELDTILKREFREDRSPVYRAMRQLETEDHRTVVPVRNEGYRVIEAREHEALARHHHKKSRRQLGKAVQKAASADRTALTPDERKRMDGLEMSLRQHAQMIRRLELRDEQRAAEIKDLRREKNADVAELSERVDRLADLLERHGVEPPSSRP